MKTWLLHTPFDIGDGGFRAISPNVMLALDAPELLLLVESQVVLREWPVEKKPESTESREEMDAHVAPVTAEDGVVVLEPEEAFKPPYILRSTESLEEATRLEKNCCIRGGLGEVLKLTELDVVPIALALSEH